MSSTNDKHLYFNFNEYFGSENQKVNTKKGGLKSSEITRTNYELRVEKYNLEPSTCRECGAIFTYDQRHKKFCNTSCSAKFNNKNRSPKVYKTLSKTLKDSSNLKEINIKNGMTKREKFVKVYLENPKKCIICHSIITYEFRHRKTCCDGCKGKLIVLNNIENNNGGFKHTSIKYKDVYLDSSWEVKVAKSLDDYNIKWIRPPGIYFVDRHKIKRRYHPDFYLIDYDVYLDPKNPFALKIQKEKIEDIIDYTKIKLLILDQNNLEWENILNVMVETWGIEPQSPIV